VVIVYKSVAAAEHGERGESGKMAAKGGFAIAEGAEMIALRPDDAGIERDETLTGHAGAGRNVLMQKPDRELLESVGEAAVASAPLGFHAEGEVVDALLLAAKLVALTDQDGVDTNVGEGIGGQHQPIAGGTQKALIDGVDAVGNVVKSRGDEFRRGRGRRGAEVGDEIGNSEVGFVANGGDDGDLRIENGLGEEFRVEGREVFEGSAAAGDDDDIDLTGAVEIRNAGGDFSGSRFTLHERWVEENVQAGVAAIDDVEEVADDGTGG